MLNIYKRLSVANIPFPWKCLTWIYYICGGLFIITGRRMHFQFSCNKQTCRHFVAKSLQGIKCYLVRLEISCVASSTVSSKDMIHSSKAASNATLLQYRQILMCIYCNIMHAGKHSKKLMRLRHPYIHALTFLISCSVFKYHNILPRNSRGRVFIQQWSCNIKS